MFDEASIILKHAKADFSQNIEDDFGRRFIDDTFASLERDTRHLQEKDSEALQKMREIKRLLQQARSIR